MLARLLAAVLVLVQPLPALGLSDWLPCPASCAHCDGRPGADAAAGTGASAAAEPACANCCETGAGAPAAPPCPCMHDAPPDQPVEPVSAPRGIQTVAAALPAAPEILRWAAQSAAGAHPPRWRAQDPPDRGSVLCVWRN